MKTIRTGKVGDLSLRLVEKDRAFIGLIFGPDNSKKAQIDGADADDVWRRLHDEAGKANPKYFGFGGARLQDVLRGPLADEFVRAAARFALGEGKPALLQMERALNPHDNAKWTVATYLPFLWRPEEHMFLKPEVTKDFAARVGHRFATDYEARLDFAVYESLLDLVSNTAAELAELKPRDRIDVQSFIWVVGDYKEDSEQPQP